MAKTFIWRGNDMQVRTKSQNRPSGVKETDKFYEALAQFGEDLFLIQTRFKDKTANQISMKLRSERKKSETIQRG